MENKDCTSKTRHCSVWKTEAVFAEVEASHLILFGGHSSGVTNKSKFFKSQHVTAAVTAASAESRNIL